MKVEPAMLIPLILLLILGTLMSAARDFVPQDFQAATVAGTELAFGFLLLAAFFGGKVVARLRSPQLTGYILVGVITGPYVLDLVSLRMVDALRIINGAAICLIALTAGGELSLKKMRPLMGTIRSMTFWAVIGTSLLLTAALFAMRPMLPFFDALSTIQALAVCLMLGVTLASQSPAVVMALINETQSDGPVSQISLALVIIADLVVIVLYAVTSSVTTALIGDGINVSDTLAVVSWELFGSAAIGLAIGVVLAMFLIYVKRGAPLFVLLICFVVAEVGIRLHLDPLIVTLTAGVYIENLSRANAAKLIHDLENASLPVYLVFFALAGAMLELDVLYSVLGPALVIAVVRAVGLWAGCRKAARVTGAAPTVARWTWLGLLPQAGLAIALALIMARTFGPMGEQAATLVLGVVGLNQIITPILLRIALVRSGEIGRRAHGEILEDEHRPDHAPATAEEVG